MEIELRGAALTHTGLVREHNEDAYLFDLERGVFALADGMGGHLGGEVAARMAVEGLEAVAGQVPDDSFLRDGSMGGRQEILGWMSRAVQDLNLQIHTRAQQDHALLGMGCTLELVVFRRDGVFLGHAGDSRCYLLRDGDLYQLTEDHTLGNLLMARGVLTPEQAARHPQRGALTRALGLSSSLEPDTTYFEVAAGDVFLLCSDGLYDGLSAEDLRQHLDTKRPQEAAERLVEAALGAGGHDNITSVVVHVHRVENEAPALVGSTRVREVMASSDLFAGFTEAELLRAQKLAIGRRFPQGATLFSQGRPCGFVMLPIDGQGSVWIDGQQIGIIGPGDPLGDMGLVATPSPVTVRAETPMTALEFPLSSLHGLLNAEPRLAAKLTFAALQRTNQRLMGLAGALARYRKAYGPTPG